MIMRRLRRTILSTVKPLATAVLCAAVVGCQSNSSRTGSGAAASVAPEDQALIHSHPEPLRPMYRRVVTGEARDRVLHQMEAGTHALMLGYPEAARRSFDEVLDRIEMTHAGTEEAAKARSLWYEEGSKEFKGEPYERAMAYYYRGLLYLQEGDFDNARAVFNGAILQDAFAEEHQNRCDFALMYLLAAYASHLIGDISARDEDFRAFMEFRPDYVEPDWDREMLAIVETGKSPRKLADGVGHYQMKLFRGKGFSDTRAKLLIEGEERTLYRTEDISFQAMTRGSRPIDAILEGQVNFKRKAEKIGTTLTETAETAVLVAPLFEGASSEMGAVAGGLGIVGVTAAMIAQNAKPRADTRYWSNLPDTVHTTFIPKSFRGTSATVQFLAGDGTVVSEKQAQIPDDAVVVWAKKNHQ